ncbi:MAG: gamma-glutamyltransferase family protein, partial [Firmicutes bacterium]|nr:gamma-glutamyltransferase family protein [Bacillota bacterium]
MRLLLKILKRTGLGLGLFLVGVVIIYLFLPKGPREQMRFFDPYHTRRPAAQGEKFMAATSSTWATEAALAIMEEGGNAFDAAMAALLVLNVTNCEASSFPCIAPTLVHVAESGEVLGYNGVGTAPAAATIEAYKAKGFKTVPKFHLYSQLLPGSPDAMVAILQRYGTKSFGEVSMAAIKLARDGFPVGSILRKNLNLSLVERLGFSILMPYNSKVYLRREWWRPLHYGDRLVLADLADTLQALADAEQEVLAQGGTRAEGLQAVRDYFYKGPLAEKIVAYHEQKGGLFTREDLATYAGYWEEPLSGQFGEYTIFANDTWCQGAVVPLTLQILAGIDLKSMGHNSPEYVHTVSQALELAMADREAYMGDPAFVDVPIKGLLNPAYADERRQAMTPGRAFGQMPPAGNPYPYEDKLPAEALQATGAIPEQGAANQQKIAHSPREELSLGKDTTYLTVVDQDGNAVSLTPSDFPESPMIPGTGLTLGVRMTQFRLEPEHPAALVPGKRPRITPNPGMVFKDGKFYMSYGTPGGDMQPQAMVQVFLNIFVFGMDPQEAVDAPRFKTVNFP